MRDRRRGGGKCLARPRLARQLRLALISKAQPERGIWRKAGELLIKRELHAEISIGIQHLDVAEVVELRFGLEKWRKLDFQELLAVCKRTSSRSGNRASRCGRNCCR